MACPATSRDLLEMIRRSGVIDRAGLEKFLQSGADLSSPKSVLDQLLNQGLLTRFQADSIRQGRWKGFLLAGYRLLDKLGSGGMGQVFLAEHLALRKRVALKVLSAQLSGEPKMLARLAREARAAAAVSHPNIVHVIDIDIDHRPAFLVMEYISGLTLQAAVSRVGTFSEGFAAFCGRQAALALQVAFEAGMVHRDIKPANLMLTPTGQLKMLDLGIVRLDTDDEHHLTTTGNQQLVLGTADYLSPEQAIDSHRVDIRADIYGLGGTLYFLLAGHSPYPVGSANAKLTRKQLEDPTPIHRLRPDLSKRFADYIMKMLARERDDRPTTPWEVANALDNFSRLDSRLLNRLFQTPATVPAASQQLPNALNLPRSARPAGPDNLPCPHALEATLLQPVNADQPTARVHIPIINKVSSNSAYATDDSHVLTGPSQDDMRGAAEVNFRDFNQLSGNAETDVIRRGHHRLATSSPSRTIYWFKVLGGVVTIGVASLVLLGIWLAGPRAIVTKITPDTARSAKNPGALTTP